MKIEVLVLAVTVFAVAALWLGQLVVGRHINRAAELADEIVVMRTVS
jgi:hypothetical protein